jgi:type IV secretory pathway TraG/TraD family ATPase VirD4
MHNRVLQLLFVFMLLSLTIYNTWVCTQQSLLDWGGLTTSPDNLWTIATLIDAYYGFITFYVWVLWKETRALPRFG